MQVTLSKINITETLDNARQLLAADKQISPALRAMFEMLLLIITLFAQRFGLNSKNSSKPPASDPDRKKKKNTKSTNKPGGQPGHVGSNLEPAKDPNKIVSIEIDKRSLPRGHQYTDAGFEFRQVVDLEISRIVTEYRAQILEDETGKRFVAPFPKGVSRPIQYGQSMKVHSVYLSQYQLIPYERIADYFIHEASIPISVGSLFNFNKEAYHLLETFDGVAKEKLIAGQAMNVDETGINVNGKRLWLHAACNEQWTYFFPHGKRGAEAMNEIDIIPKFKGTLIHDHWKPYYIYHCLHALCNAHHLRELQWVIDNHPHYTWAKELQTLLLAINDAVNLTEKNCLDEKEANLYEKCYRQIIKIGDEQMPLAAPDPNAKKTKGRKKKTKERNLLERLRDFEGDTLRFMRDPLVPFTNNAGENDLRMTKVQQKISGCFRSMEGAKIFCRVRSYLLTAQKHGITATDALKTLFAGKLPEVFFQN